MLVSWGKTSPRNERFGFFLICNACAFNTNHLEYSFFIKHRAQRLSQIIDIAIIYLWVIYTDKLNMVLNKNIVFKAFTRSVSKVCCRVI